MSFETETGMRLRLWGVRGSLPCAGPETQRYGGNTACIEVRCGPHLIILDAGSGARLLGAHLGKDKKIEADWLFTHTHLDHIMGLPFFAPCYIPGNRFRLRAGHLGGRMTVRGAIKKMMAKPLFPIPMDVFRAKMDCRDFKAGATLRLRKGLLARTAKLNHPDGATGYRIEYGGKSICYVTDTEHRPGTLDANILELTRGADIMIYDSTYTDEEFPRFKGWGHSTWQEGVRLAQAAGVRTCVIFHHDPGHDDVFMDGVAAQAAAAHPGTLVAREGMVLRP
jgi:phosphoribosyl 1,2-cyclic phosphodiesterase